MFILFVIVVVLKVYIFRGEMELILNVQALMTAIKISQSALSSSTYTDYYSGINNTTSSHASDYSLDENGSLKQNMHGDKLCK